MRIKSVRLTNYKRFASLTLTNILESTRLVVLLGPNGCGKSSVFDAFLAKSQDCNGTTMHFKANSPTTTRRNHPLKPH